ncbi:hypothetical protein D3C85_1882760 [compost metagenome]
MPCLLEDAIDDRAGFGRLNSTLVGEGEQVGSGDAAPFTADVGLVFAARSLAEGQIVGWC